MNAEKNHKILFTLLIFLQRNTEILNILKDILLSIHQDIHKFNNNLLIYHKMMMMIV